MLFGLIDFLAFFFKIEPLKEIFYFIVNQRQLANNTTGEAVKVIVHGIPRVQSFFVEPGLFSYFTALILPFIYKLSFSARRIFSNYYFDKIIKKTLPTITWFNIIFTQSPIGILFALTVTLYYTFTNTRITTKRLIIYITLIILTFTSLFIFFNLNEMGQKIFSRIETVIFLFSNFNKFSILEESLATRLVFYINCIIIFMNNPILGVGWGHLGLDLAKQLPLSPVPLTYEIINNLAKTKNTTAYGLVISYRILAETGFIGFLLFYCFIIKIILKLKKYLKTLKGHIYDIMHMFYLYLILFIIFSFYESLLYAPHYWVLIGLIISVINNKKIKEFI